MPKQSIIRALLFQYSKVIGELKFTISDVEREELIRIADPITKNKDCISIQSVLTHIIVWGYNYLEMIRQNRGEIPNWPKRITYEKASEYSAALDKLIVDSDELLLSLDDTMMFEPKPERKIKTSWGQLYDIEQLMEHAIVHVMRHHRQIEKFIKHSNYA